MEQLSTYLTIITHTYLLIPTWWRKHKPLYESGEGVFAF